MRKEGQAWGFDLIIASIIFITGIVVFYLYSLNYPTEGQEKIDMLSYEASLIADSILSEGHPTDWDENTAIRIGLLTNDALDNTKIANFDSLATSDYEKTRRLFNTKYNYYINFTKTEIPIIGNKPDLESEVVNLVRVSRLSIYQNKPTEINIFVWE